jgi:hypothetical protein
MRQASQSNFLSSAPILPERIIPYVNERDNIGRLIGKPIKISPNAAIP